MAQTPEGRVKAAVKKWLTERGIWYFLPANNGMGRSGIPDFICCWHGHFLAIETKAPGRLTNTTPNQDQRLQEISDHGGLSLIVDDVSQLSRVEAWMKSILQTT
jgi:hypothetical protein